MLVTRAASGKMNWERRITVQSFCAFVTMSDTTETTTDNFAVLQSNGGCCVKRSTAPSNENDVEILAHAWLFLPQNVYRKTNKKA